MDRPAWWARQLSFHGSRARDLQNVVSITPNSDAKSLFTGMAAIVTPACFFDMIFNHLPDIHAVDMVRTEDGNHVRVSLLNEIDVLVNCIGCSPIPVFIS